MRIDRVEVRVVGPQVQRFTWSHDLPEQYMTNTVVRIFTDDGVEGFGGVSNYTSHAHDRYTAETLRHLVPALIGQDPLEREALWRSLWSRVFPLAPGALAVVDIALWDLLGKASNLPIYQLLGGSRQRIPSYASTPMLEDVAAYLDFVDQLMEQGFRAVKFHCWCVPDRDLELARAVRERHAPDRLALMLDVENNYDWDSALRVAWELEALEFTWFEAPLMDYDLEGYRKLTRRVEIPIVPSGELDPGPACLSGSSAQGGLEPGPDGRHRLQRPDAGPQGHGAGGGRRHEVRGDVVGKHAGFGGQPASHAGFQPVQLFRAGRPLRTLRVWDEGRDPDRAGRDGGGARRSGPGCGGGLGSHGRRHPAQLHQPLGTAAGH